MRAKKQPPTELNLVPKLVGEIVALRLATQVVASVLAWKTAMGNEGMAAMHGISQNTLDHMTLDLLEINETEVRTYAGTMLDEIFTNSNIAV